MMHTSPLKTIERSQCVAAPSAHRVACCVCDKTYAGGAIADMDEHSVWLDDHGCHGLLRGIYCDHCDHLMTWLESRDGIHSPGLVLTGPGIIRQREAIDRFLKRFPQCQGVTQ